MVEEAAQWLGDQDWVAHLPFKRIAEAVLPNSSSNDADAIQEDEQGEENDSYDTGDEGDGKDDYDEKEDNNDRDTAASRSVNQVQTAKVAASSHRPPARSNPSGAPRPAQKKAIPPTPKDTKKEENKSVVSRRSDAIVLIALACLYASLAILCFVAYGTGGKYWYDRTPQTLTTVLAILGVAFSLLNKFSTVKLTTAYRREVGADLLGRKGLTLQNLMHYDQYVNRSTMSLLGSKGFRSITMPVGICIIVASALIKKSFNLSLVPAPDTIETVNMIDFAIADSQTLLRSATLTSSSKQRQSNPNANQKAATLSNMTSSLQFGLFYSYDLFVAQYYNNDTDYDSNVPTTTDNLFGTPLLPDYVANAKGNISFVQISQCPVIMAKQIPIHIEGGLYTLVSNIINEPNVQEGESEPSTITTNKTGSDLSSQLNVYTYDNTFGLGYYEYYQDVGDGPYTVEVAFELYTAMAYSFFNSSGASDFATIGGPINSTLNSENQLNVTISDSDVDHAADSARDLIDAILASMEIPALYNASTYDQEYFFQELLDVAATLTLAYATQYTSDHVVEFRNKYKTTTATVVKLKETLIFGSNYYTLILGLLLCVIGAAVGAWAFKSVRKPMGVEFNMITAMSLVANAIDPNTDLTQAINHVESEAQRQQMVSKDLLTRPVKRNQTHAAAATAAAVRRPASQSAADPEKAMSSSPINATASSNTRRPAIQPRQRRNTAFNPANVRIGLDMASRLIKLVDEDASTSGHVS